MLTVQAALTASPTITEALVALPLAAASAACLATLLSLEKRRDVDHAVALLIAAAYLPGVLLARYVVVPFFEARIPEHEVLTALPPWLNVTICLTGAAWLGAKVLSWGANRRGRRQRLRTIGRVAFWALWLPFWAWVLVEVASPAELIDDPHLVAILAVSGLLGLVDAVVTPRVEDRLMPCAE